jgi:CDP-diacylglycerol---glycerol-3-phosphate 3-phosphatidyltransferase
VIRAMTAEPSADPAAAPANPSAPLLNAANGLTALRLALVPVFAGLALASDMADPGLRIAACSTFAIASITDYVDGWVARSRNLITGLGKVADPIADKALTGTALLLLSAYHLVPWWVTIVILVRELGVTALRVVVLRRGAIPVSRGGKLKTALQLFAIGWYLWPMPPLLAVAGPWLMYAATAVTVVTGVDYVVRALRLWLSP